MKHWLVPFAFLVCIFAAGASRAAGAVEGFVLANGVRLQYFDWGGAGPTLIFVHGLADNPHVFDDLAPAFVARFHIITYARRGSGSSDVSGPYDVATLTDDLCGLMDALRIAKADLVGLSAGGEEITRMATAHPRRVGRLVYLDAGYEFGPDFRDAVRARPFGAFDRPAGAMVSLDAYRSYLKAMWYPGLDDLSRLEANIRAKVIVQADGSVRERTPKEVVDALYAALWANTPRDYSRVRSPALAIYAEHYYDLSSSDDERRRKALKYQREYWEPLQAKSIARIRREMANVEIVRVPGAHSSFHLTGRQRILDQMLRFLGPPARN